MFFITKYGDFGMRVEKEQFFSYIINKIDIEILDSGIVYGDEEWRGKNICSPYSRLYYIKEGFPVIKYNSQTLKMKPGYAYLVPAGHTFSYYCDDNYEKIFFHFNVTGPNGYDLFGDLKDCPYDKLSVERIEEIMKWYCEESITASLKIREEILSRVISLLPEKKITQTSELMYSPGVQRTIDYIRLNLSVQLTTKELAEQLFICESTLCKKFKNEVGVTIGTYIDDLIFFNAEKMLLKTKWSINQISETLGFCDQFYFSRRFKNKFGQTPLQYRKKLSTAL